MTLRSAVVLAFVGLPTVLTAQGGSIVTWSPMSVRFSGLNGAGAALVGHAGTIFTNPAGLATIRHIAVETSYRVDDLDAYLASAAMGWRLGQFDVGVGARRYKLGLDAQTMVNNRVDIGPDTTDQIYGVGSIIYRFPLIALGVSGKHLRHDDPAGPVDRATSFDIGAVIAIFDIMALGVAVQNVGGNWAPNSTIVMPRLTRAGFTMNYVDPQETFRLLSAVEMQWETNIGSRFVLGGEGGIVIGTIGVVGRLGYASRVHGEAGDAWSYGATLELNIGKIDVGYQPDQATGAGIRRLGFRLAF